MGPTRTILTALGCSLVLHVLGLELYAQYGSVLLLTPPRYAGATTRPAELVVSVDPQMLDFGEATGTGIAANKSDGDHPQQAREADENQAYLDRRQAGNSDDGIAKRLEPNVGDSAASAMHAPAAPITPSREQPVTPNDVKANAFAMAPLPPPPPLPEAAPDSNDPKAVAVAATQPDIKVDPALPQPTATPQPAAPATPPLPPAQVASGQAGSAPVAGAMVPHSDSDSDPFMRLSGSVVFRAGKLDVQMGRKVTTVRPQLGIGGMTDAWTMAQPTLVVEAHIDSTGHVTQVDLPKKTGSPAIDEPTRNAVYQWVFEPTHDKQGRAVPDVVFFEIDYR